MIFFLLFVVFPICLIFLLPKVKRGRKNKLPPGPIGLPFIGNLHQFDSLARHIYFWKLSKKYGKILSLKLASVQIVVVSSAKLAKEVLKTQDLVFCSRPSLVGQQKLSYNGHDIGFASYNDYWREMRKICFLHLFSLKKVQLFGLIRKDEVSRMIKKIYQLAVSSQVTNLSNLMISLNSTIICRVAFGVRFDEEAHERKRFDHIMVEAQAMLASFFVSDFFPSLSWIDKLTGLTDRLEKNFKDLNDFYEELIEQHHNPNRPKSMEGDIIDLLPQLKKEQLTPIDLSLEDIKGILMNVLVAGSDTSASVIIWAMTILIKNPKAMKKVQEEIRNLMGNKNIVNEDDIQNMPYFKAVIKETLRLFPPVPLLIPRESMKISTLEGYEFQPRTIVYVNAWAIGRDPEIWENSEEFMPERFLNSDIDFFDFHFFLNNSISLPVPFNVHHACYLLKFRYHSSYFSNAISRPIYRTFCLHIPRPLLPSLHKCQFLPHLLIFDNSDQAHHLILDRSYIEVSSSSYSLKSIIKSLCEL